MNESEYYRPIEKVITHIDRHHAGQPDLGKLAREFRRWAGLPPVRYLQTRSLSVAKQKLDERGFTFKADLAAGLSGGDGLQLRHGFAQSPFGRIVLTLVGAGFQVKIWGAPLEFGSRGPTSYSATKAAFGNAGAGQAVGQAVGASPMARLIPFRRALRRDGGLGGCHWGVARKRVRLVSKHATITRASGTAVRNA